MLSKKLNASRNQCCCANKTETFKNNNVLQIYSSKIWKLCKVKKYWAFMLYTRAKAGFVASIKINVTDKPCFLENAKTPRLRTTIYRSYKVLTRVGFEPTTHRKVVVWYGNLLNHYATCHYHNNIFFQPNSNPNWCVKWIEVSNKNISKQFALVNKLKANKPTTLTPVCNERSSN